MELELVQTIYNNVFATLAFLLMYQLCKTTIKENTQAIRDLTIILESK